MLKVEAFALDSGLTIPNSYAIISAYVTTGNVSIQLYDEQTHEPQMRVTCNISKELPLHQICIKDYSENAGVQKAFIMQGLVEPQPVELVQQGFVQVSILKMKPKLFDHVVNTARQEQAQANQA